MSWTKHVPYYIVLMLILFKICYVRKFVKVYFDLLLLF